MVKTFRDGRVVLSGKDYAAHKEKVWLAQGKKCWSCGWYLPIKYTEFDHFAGRGLAGGKRNDLDERNRILCHDCHILAGKRDTDRNGARRR